MYLCEEFKYKLPINMEPEWAKFFKPDYSFKKVNLTVKKINNVFVNHYGLVLKNGLLVKGCAPNIGFSSYDEGFYFKHWRKVFEQKLVCKYGKSLKAKTLSSENKYLLIHSPWFSYYFWISECIPRLLSVKEDVEDLILIYPESWKNLSFVNNTLSLFPKLRKEIIPKDLHLNVPKLVMPEVKPWTPMFIPKMVLETKYFIEEVVKQLNIEIPIYERIYISRKKAQRRKFLDENEIEAFLKKHGFQSIVMEDYSFFEQVYLMMNAKVTCGITGAGHINAMFMPKGSYFFDFTNQGYKNSKIYKFHYYKLCNIVHVNYLVQFFNFKEKPEIKKFSQQPLIPDYNLLERNINLINQ